MFLCIFSHSTFLCFSCNCNFLSGILKYVPPCELKGGGCSRWNVKGWKHIELGKIETSIPFSGKVWCYCIYILLNYCVSLRNLGDEYS
jgi:hypothetical protein